ncbi:MAG: DUF481 domain-containing protein [bacterium]|nr:DUF481 domain-containing protein [bacterium]
MHIVKSHFKRVHEMRSVRYGLVGIAVVLGLACSSGRLLAADEPLNQWTGSVDLSLITATGNSKTRTGSANAIASKRTEKDRWIGRAGGLTGSSDGDKVAEYYYANGEYNYFHTPKTYSIYFLGWEKDKLAGLDSRLTARIGLGHEFMKTDRDFFVGEAGVAYVRENREDGTEGFPEGRLFGRYEHLFREGVKFIQELEYLQDLSLMKNYRLRSLTALEMAINSRWALKTALKVHFDNTPTPGFRETDTITETSLVYKF